RCDPSMIFEPTPVENNRFDTGTFGALCHYLAHHARGFHLGFTNHFGSDLAINGGCRNQRFTRFVINHLHEDVLRTAKDAKTRARSSAMHLSAYTTLAAAACLILLTTLNISHTALPLFLTGLTSFADNDLVRIANALAF